jgi:flagellar basal-body rod modification protein FlgD
MTVHSIGGNTRTEPSTRSTATAQTGTKDLERDSFMELLLLQLRSQDPMNPMDSSAMFNQMAQLSMLEQLWDIRDMLSENTVSQQLAQGATLLGRQVEANSAEVGQVSGLVEGVRMMSGAIWLQIGDSEVRLDEVMSVQ